MQPHSESESFDQAERTDAGEAAEFDAIEAEPSQSEGVAQVDQGEVTVPPERRELAGELGRMSLPRQVLALALWPLLEQLLNLTVGTVDLMLAGALEPGHTAIAATDALGVGGFINWLMIIILGSIGVGSTALIARAVGGRHKGLANATVGQSLVLAAAVGLVLMVAMFFAARPVGLLINRSGLALTFVEQFLQIMALAAPGMAILLVGNKCLQGAGDTQSPFVIMTIVNAINISVSWLLVFGPAPFGGHQVAGIAAGTVVAWSIGAAIVIGVLRRGGTLFKLHRHRLRFQAATLRRILRIGVPNLIESAGGTWLATFIVLIFVGWLPGEGLVGAHMIAIRIESYSFQPGFAFGVAAATLVGQYLGLGDTHRAARALALGWGFAVALMGAVGVVFILMPESLARIFTYEPALIENIVPLVRICGTIQIFFATYLVVSFALKGAGDTKMAMKLTYSSVFLVRVPAAYILAFPAGLGLVGIWLALCADLVVKAMLFAGRYLHGGWRRIEV
jgi:putative MATE family efflux protein